jgi:hypothetical protein
MGNRARAVFLVLRGTTLIVTALAFGLAFGAALVALGVWWLLAHRRDVE